MSRSIGDLLRVSFGMAAAQFISLSAIPIITRLYLPEDYGYLGAYMSITGFLMIAATGRYHLALVVSQDADERRGLVLVSLMFILASTLLSLLIALGAGEAIERAIGMPGLAVLLWLWPLSNVAGGLYLVLQYWCTAHRQFGALGTAYATEALLGASIVILAGFLVGSSDAWPIVARVLAVFGAVALLAGLAAHLSRSTPAQGRRRLDRHQLRHLVAKYRRFLLLTSPAALLNTLALAGPPLILAAFFDAAVLALFLIADRLLSVPLTVFGTSFGHVIYQDASERFGKGPLTEVLQEPLKRLVRIGYFALGLIAVCGPTLFEIALGQSWAEAGQFAQILALGAFVRLLAAPFTNVTGSLGRQDIDLHFNILLAVGRNAAVVLGAVYLGLMGSIALLSFVSAIIYAYLLIRVFAVTEVSLLSVFKSMRLEVICQSLILLFVWVMEFMFGGYYTLLAAFLGALLWLVLLYRHDREFMEVVKQRGFQSG